MLTMPAALTATEAAGRAYLRGAERPSTTKASTTATATAKTATFLHRRLKSDLWSRQCLSFQPCHQTGALAHPLTPVTRGSLLSSAQRRRQQRPPLRLFTSISVPMSPLLELPQRPRTTRRAPRADLRPVGVHHRHLLRPSSRPVSRTWPRCQPHSPRSLDHAMSTRCRRRRSRGCVGQCPFTATVLHTCLCNGIRVPQVVPYPRDGGIHQPALCTT
jgi:hypothetical protein